MHNQALVIYPNNVKLDDVMYWYQEIDKDIDGRMNDERCNFVLSIPKNEIFIMLDKIEKKLKKQNKKYYDMVKYRAMNSLESFKKKYNHGADVMSYYTDTEQDLAKYNRIKDLFINHPDQINFIKAQAFWVDDNILSAVYIKDIGYGDFINIYEMYDYYTTIDEMRFPKGTHFLINKNGESSNNMNLSDLDINKTIENINVCTNGWQYIIFCKEVPEKSKLYTTDDIRFGYEYNNKCLVNDIEETLNNIVNKYKSDYYIVSAIDFHW